MTLYFAHPRLKGGSISAAVKCSGSLRMPPGPVDMPPASSVDMPFFFCGYTDGLRVHMPSVDLIGKALGMPSVSGGFTGDLSADNLDARVPLP